MMTPSWILLGNGSVAARFLASCRSRGQGPMLVVLNESRRQRDAAELREAAGGDVLEWSEDTRRRLMGLVAGQPDVWLVSVYFGHILDGALLQAAGGRSLNLHPSLLPWGRGAHTNVWPIVEHTPAGVTLHVMEPRVDSGAVIGQREVAVEPWDTAGTLYRKLEDAALDLLLEWWPERAIAAWPGRPQAGAGSAHRVADLATLDEVTLGADGEARRLFDLLRARSFPPYPGLRVRLDGRVVECVIELRESGHD